MNIYSCKAQPPPLSWDFATLSTMCLCLAVLVGIQYIKFGKSKKYRSSKNISSFFTINEICAKWQRNICAGATTIPLSFLFLLAALYSSLLNRNYIQILIDSGEVDKIYANLLSELVEFAPQYTYPVILLAILFALFWERLVFLYRKVEDFFIFAAGVRRNANDLSLRVSRYLLDKWTYEEILQKLEKNTNGRIPLAVELEGLSEDLRLSFQILYLAREYIPEVGLKGAFVRLYHDKLSGEIDFDEFNEAILENSLQGLEKFSLEVRRRGLYLFASVFAFLVVCGLYIGIVPLAHDYLTRSFEIDWPRIGKIGGHAEGVALVAFGSIFPVVIALILFLETGPRYFQTASQRLIGIFVIVALLSAFINFSFLSAKRIGVLIGIFEGEVQVFMGVPEYLYIVIHSVIPGIVVLSIILVDKKRKLSWVGVFIGVVVAAIAHLISMACYEMVGEIIQQGASESKYVNGASEESVKRSHPYFWHQGLLGFVLSATALGILKIFWSKPEESS